MVVAVQMNSGDVLSGGPQVWGGVLGGGIS